jgi:hypothetical protein
VKRDFLDAETSRAALETLLVVFMYEDHPVIVLAAELTLVVVSTEYSAQTARRVHQGPRECDYSFGVSGKHRLLFQTICPPTALESPESSSGLDTEMSVVVCNRDISSGRQSQR